MYMCLYFFYTILVSFEKAYPLINIIMWFKNMNETLHVMCWKYEK